MKNNSTRFGRSFLAALLAFLMIFATLAPTVMAVTAEEDSTRYWDTLADTDKTPTKNKKDTINYVSLGDSMSNGYCLDDVYEHNGYHNYGVAAYPNQFASWLVSAGYANNVNHSQLAMSGMRVEDLLLVLTADYGDGFMASELAPENPLQKEFLDAVGANPDANGYDKADMDWNASLTLNGVTKTVGEHFKELFLGADYYNYNSQVTSRYDHYGKCSNTNHTKCFAGGTTAIAKEYQEAVANADIITLAIGNGNFGVFLFHRALELSGFMSTSIDVTEEYNAQAVIDRCENPMLKNAFITLYAEVEKLFDQEAGALAEYGLEGDSLDSIKELFLYVALSYVESYVALIERIAELNPDVEIVLVGNMNTHAGLDSTLNGEPIEIGMGELVGAMVEPANTFLALLPTYLQNSEAETYGDMTFYYAAEPAVECVVDVYKDNIYSAANTTIRKRFVSSIVGDYGDGMVWSLAKPLLSKLHYTLVTVSYDDIVAFESALKNAEHKHTEKCHVCNENCEDDCDKACLKSVDNVDDLVDYIGAALSNDDAMNKMVSCVIYLGFEKAVLASSNIETLDLSAILMLLTDPSGLAAVFTPIINSIQKPNADDYDDEAEYNRAMENYNNGQAAIADVMDVVYAVMASITQTTLESTFNDMLIDYLQNNGYTGDPVSLTVPVTGAQIGAILAGGEGANTAAYEVADAALDAVVELLLPIFPVMVADKVAPILPTLLNAINSQVSNDSQGYVTINLTLEGYRSYLEVAADADNLTLVRAFYTDATSNYTKLAAYVDSFDVESQFAALDINDVTGSYIVGQIGTKDDDAVNAAATTLSDTTAEMGILAELQNMLGMNPRDYIAGEVTSGVDAEQAGALGMLVAMPEIIGGAADSDPLLLSMLHLFARNIIGDGAGAHPSQNGHNDLADAVIESYHQNNGIPASVVLEKLYSIYDLAGKAGLFDNIPELSIAEEIYSYLDTNDYISDDQMLNIILCVYNAVIDRDLNNADLLGVGKYTYETLMYNDKLSDTDRISIIGNIYSILNDNYYLNSYKAVKVVENIYTKLDANGLISDEQSYAIVDTVYSVIIYGNVTADEVLGVGKYVYETLMYNDELSYEDRTSIIGSIYSVINDNYHINNYKAVKVIENIYTKLDANGLISDEQSYKIVDRVYNAIIDGNVTADEVLEVIVDIYDILITNRTVAPAVRAVAASAEDELEAAIAAENAAALRIVLGELLDSYVEDEETKALVETFVTGENPAISDAILLELTKSVVDVVKDPENEGAAPEVLVEKAATAAVDTVLHSENIPAEEKANLIGAIGTVAGGAIGGNETGSEVTGEALKVLMKVYVNLIGSGLVTDEDAKAVVTWIYENYSEAIANGGKLSEEQIAEIVASLYTVVITEEYLTHDAKIDIVLNIYNTLKEEGYIEKLISSLEDLYNYVMENYEEIYAYAYGKLDEAGYIELANGYLNDYVKIATEKLAVISDMIDNIENKLLARFNGGVASVSALRRTGGFVAPDKTTEELADEIEAEILKLVDEIKAAVEAVKSVYESADTINAEAVVTIKNAAAAASDATEQLLTLLAENGFDENDEIYQLVLELQTWITQFEDYTIEQLDAAIEAAKAALTEKLEELYEEVVDALVKAIEEHGYEVAEKLYNYIMENPEDVIEFVSVYGPVVIELADRYSEEIIDVVCYVAENYGDDVVKFLLDNYEEILGTLAELVEEYGDEAWEIVKVYAETSGLTAKVEAGLAEAKAELDALITALTAELETLNAELETKINETKAALEAALAEKRAQLEELKAKVEAGIDEAEAALIEMLEGEIAKIEAMIAELDAAIAAIEAKIAEVEAKIAEAKAALEAICAEIAKVVEKVNALNDALANLVEEAKAAMNGAVADLQGAVEDVKAALDAL
ncbi:MAG: apolipoprotein A1/A4/E family protein, partial [Clostridia bacterium]|nr:apolipoprotein A1/A4/E family protein [Clostridia bacterium]